jgi:molybdate transport system regulatory protein
LNNKINIPLPKSNIESSIKSDVKVRLLTTIPFFGPGVADLLEAIEDKQSVSLACKKIGMSYSKGWKIIQKFKSATGFDLVITQKGGNTGGLTELTSYGKKILIGFRHYENDVKKYSQERFDYYLSEIEEMNDEY